MKTIGTVLSTILLIFIFSCDSEGPESLADLSDSGAAASSFSEGASSGSSGGTGQGGGQSGLITAGEWNDLDNWDFWKNLVNNQGYEDKPAMWSFYTNNRISVLVTDQSAAPIADVKVAIKENGVVVWAAKTDNLGKAELWIGLNEKKAAIEIANYSLFVNNEVVPGSVKLNDNGTNVIILTSTQAPTSRVELSFIVDATGSMADELEFLKDDLQDVIQKVEGTNPNLNILTSTVFYRDEGDDYVVKHSAFTDNISTTSNYINQQSASGGGDFPEAVHTALKTAINELQWSEVARTRIALLLLDAPPHENQQIIDDLQHSIKLAAEKGIKIIPITASGIGKETEFLMRFFAIATNGTYVFITNDSGIGNDHLEPSIGEYEVEYLNNLLVRLINKYTE